MTNKELIDYTIMKDIMKEPDPKRREHKMDTFVIMKSMERQREQNMEKARKGLFR